MPTPTASLTVQKTLPCSPTIAFQAWTDPEQFKQWFTPMPGMQTTAQFDLRRGGKYQIQFQPSEAGKPQVIVDGEFLAIEPPRYLEYTWIWAWPGEPGGPNHSVVKVNFRDLGQERTELVLTHEGFTDLEDRDGHNRGWSAILEHMAAAFSAKKRGA